MKIQTGKGSDMNTAKDKQRRKTITMGFTEDEYRTIERAAEIHYFRPWELAKKVFKYWVDETVFGEPPCWPPRFVCHAAGEKLIINTDGVILDCAPELVKQIGCNLFDRWQRVEDKLTTAKRFHAAAMEDSPIIETRSGTTEVHTFHVYPVFEKKSREIVAYRIALAL